jgi:hypothetical protein
MPFLATLGVGSIGAYVRFRNAVIPERVYIEDVFSTYLYTGNGGSQTITNGINLSGKGGMLWTKQRNSTGNNGVFDSVRGIDKKLVTNATLQQTTDSYYSSWNSDGFTLNTSSAEVNGSGSTYASWTFREQAKFFDVVTYSGNGVNGRQISHNLGSTPGTIIVKVLNAADNWPVWHRSADGTLRLDSTEGTGSFTNVITATSSTTFTVTNNGEINGNGYNYVAYLFAHDAGGFGASGTDNVITCGSFLATGSGGPSEINLGYEPQWVMLKTINSTGSWTILDNMRGWVGGTTGDSSRLFANLSNAESAASLNFRITPTGFTNTSGTTNYIYIAIRRGPMKTPTSGTSVYYASTWGGGTSGYAVTGANFPPDTVLLGWQTSVGSYAQTWSDKLRGVAPLLSTTSTAAEDTTYPIASFNQAGFSYSGGNWTAAEYNRVHWLFRRAPGFMDIVCYTGTGSATTQTHNLGVAPELLIIKSRSQTIGWNVWSQFGTQRNDYKASLNSAGDYGFTGGDLVWGTPGSGAPSMTSTTFSIGSYIGVNNSGSTYVAYLFATVAGVSKVGSYTGTGTTQTINCGFTAGSRFVMIKRIDIGFAGDWYVWDSARGIVAGNDPYLLMNSTAAEVTNTDYIDPVNSGFEISSTAPAAINASGGTFIFLAIA